MEYKKIVKNNITFHLINTNRFKSISIVMFLTKEFSKESIAYGNLITNNLVYSSKKYNSKNKISRHGEKLYGAKVGASYSINGKCESLIFSLDFVNPKYTNNKYMNESLDFFKEVLLNPNVNNNEFNKEYFEIIKNDTISSINSVKDNPNLFASIEYAKIMYKNTPCEYSYIPKLEDVVVITPKDLYNYYKTLFNGNYKIDVCFLGEVDESIIDLFYKKFKSIKSNNNKLSFTINHKYKNKEITKIDSLKYNQSKLYMGYSLNDMSDHELNHVLKVYNTILGTMNDSILFNVVREENSLCYSIGSYYSKYNFSLTIYAGINKNNYNQTINLVKKCIDSMSDKKVISKLFESAKKTINTYLNNYYDDSINQINNYYYSEFENIEDIETLRENINKVTIGEVININKKIKLNVIYLLRGDNN